jgi:predicted RNA-binding protein with TRAM domain
MFHTTVITGSDTGEPVVEVPDSELKEGPLAEGETYRIAVLGPAEDGNNLAQSASPSENTRQSVTDGSGQAQQYPVCEGERLNVEIESMGDEGDGIAKVRGYAIIVPGATVGDELEVQISNTNSSHAFAEPVNGL